MDALGFSIDTVIAFITRICKLFLRRTKLVTKHAPAARVRVVVPRHSESSEIPGFFRMSLAS
jgi:hypothetical protein